MPTSKGTSSIQDISFGNYSMLQASVGKTIVYQKPIYEFLVDQTKTEPNEIISYTGYNKAFTPVQMDFANDTFNYGSWKNSWLLDRFKPCMLHSNGTVECYLNKENTSLREDGTNVSTELTSTDHDMNVMVELGQIWIKEEVIDDDHFHIYLAPYQVDKEFDCWSHYNIKNKLLKKIYISRFLGSLDSNNKMRSLGGQMPNNHTTGTLQRQYVQANGDGWDFMEWSIRRLLEYVVLLLGKSTDSAEVFGYGSHSVLDQNTTTNQLIMTGNSGGKSWFYGTNNDRYAHVEVLGIEDIWGNLWSHHNGVISSNDSLYVKMTPNTADGSKGTNYSENIADYVSIGNCGLEIPLEAVKGNRGSITKMKLIPSMGLFPCAWDISTTGTHPTSAYKNWPDIYYLSFYNDIHHLVVGSSFHDITYHGGIFARSVNYNMSFPDEAFGCTLCYKSPN